jgi:hypothetical protein
VPSELVPVFTTAAEEAALVAGACVDVLVVLLFELLPHAAMSSEAASEGMASLRVLRTVSLPILLRLRRGVAYP